MAVTLAGWLVGLAGIYVALGVVFALAFVTKGVGAIDPVAKEGTIGFRLLIFPGAVALWPLLAKRWYRGVTEPPAEETPHRMAANMHFDPFGRNQDAA